MDIQNNQTQELFEKLYVKNAPSWALERDSDGSYKYHATQSAFSLFEQQQAEIELLKSDLAKAQAVPDLGELQERIAGHQYYHDERGHMIVDMDDVVKEISGFDSWKTQAVPEGFVLVSAEQLSQWGHMANYAEQYGCPECFEARGYAHNLGCESNAYFNVSEAQEPQITELKVEWASDCFKCGHHEAIIYSTAAEASTKGWCHDGDEVKCTGCGNTGEMDARGEDSDICWNEDEAND